MSIVNSIFPKQCLICSKIGFDICPKCLRKLPHSLPSCCVCGKLNRDYYSHRDCLKKHIQCFTGWYLSKDWEYKLQKKKKLQIFTIYTTLLDSLITYLKIEDIVKESKVYPIPSKISKEREINTYLARYLKGKKNKHNILFIGEHRSQIKLLNKEKEYLYADTNTIRVLALFIPPPQAIPPV
jgi:hypothetical protein